VPGAVVTPPTNLLQLPSLLLAILPSVSHSFTQRETVLSGRFHRSDKSFCDGIDPHSNIRRFRSSRASLFLIFFPGGNSGRDGTAVMEGVEAVEFACVFSFMSENLLFAEETALEGNGSSFPPPPVEVPLEFPSSEAEIFSGFG
jgi:hypothetical protein